MQVQEEIPGRSPGRQSKKSPGRQSKSSIGEDNQKNKPGKTIKKSREDNRRVQSEKTMEWFLGENNEGARTHKKEQSPREAGSVQNFAQISVTLLRKRHP